MAINDNETKITIDSNVRWLTHVIAAIKPMHQVTIFGDNEHGGRNTVDGNNMALVGYSQSSNNINITVQFKKNMKISPQVRQSRSNGSALIE